MHKTILITGATDGIGLATTKSLIALGHRLLIHGRSAEKLAAAKQQLLALSPTAQLDTYCADLSVMADIYQLLRELQASQQQLDVLINNAGVFMLPETVSADGLDVRFMVNTIAPYLLTTQLLPLLGDTGRVINLSSAAQAPINPDELSKPSSSAGGTVYAQSKLALTMWSCNLSKTLAANGPAIIAVNPASFLGSKMVKEAYGVAGGDLKKGADILVKAALSEEFANATGLYFDNDIGRFSSPHQDALDATKTAKLTQTLDTIIARYV